jgi:hypothetical protein
MYSGLVSGIWASLKLGSYLCKHNLKVIFKFVMTNMCLLGNEQQQKICT